MARSIAGLGLEDYYRLRAAHAATPKDEADDPAALDDREAQSRFVREHPEGGAEAELLIEGLQCAACAWLVEQAARRVSGVRSAQVDFASRRACIRWDRDAAPLSAILRAIRDVGYGAWPYEAGRVEAVERREKRDLLRRLAIAALGMMQVMMYAWPAYVATDEITADVVGLMHWAGLVLTLPVLLYSGAPFFRGAWRDLRSRHLGMDVPIALGLAVAYAASAWNTAAGTGAVYFDSVTMFVFLLLGARYLEMLARARAGRALAHLARWVPRVAHKLPGKGAGGAMNVDAATLDVGDRVLVRAGESVPADGVLEGDAAEVNEAWMSGESRALAREQGDRVLAGSINAGSAFVLRVERSGTETQLAAIHRLIDRAGAQRPPIVDAAQRASRHFVAVVLVAALAAALAWAVVDPPRMVEAAVAVLIITCPCALALATPTALTAGRGALARSGVVVTRGRALEGLASATHVVFDKTGTLTAGQPQLLDTIVLGRLSAGDALAMAAALGRASSHPLDRALVAAAEAHGTKPAVTTMLPESRAGAGLDALVDGRHVRLGRSDFVAALHHRPAPVRWIDAQDTLVWLGDEQGWIAAFRLGDRTRSEARECVAALGALGLTPHLLTGDSQGVAARVATELGIAAVRARSDPDHKRDYVMRLQSAGARVLMVGDGINDGPVLAAADVSIAMGSGADLAQLRADAVLLSESLADLPAAVRVARKTRRIVRQNLAWALAYNVIAIPLAAAGLVTPLVAAIGMSASSLVVVANALRLRA